MGLKGQTKKATRKEKKERIQEEKEERKEKKKRKKERKRKEKRKKKRQKETGSIGKIKGLRAISIIANCLRIEKEEWGTRIVLDCKWR